MPSRYELIQNHRKAFNAFAKAGIDPTRHCVRVDMYEARKSKQRYGGTKETAREFNCSRQTVRNAKAWMEKDV